MLKIFSPFKKDINTTTTVLLVAIGMIFILSINYILEYTSKDNLTKDIVLYLGAVLIAPLVVLILHYLLIRPRIRIISLVIAGGIVIFIIAMVISFIVNAITLSTGPIGPISGVSITLPEIVSKFFQGMGIGAMMSSIIYLILAKTHKIIYVIYFFIFVCAVGTSAYKQSKNTSMIVLFGIILFCALIFSTIYFVWKFKINRKQAFRTVNPVFIAFFILLIIGSIFGGLFIANQFEKNAKEVQDIKNAQNERKRLNIQGSGSSSSGALGFDYRNLLKNSVVGFYTASKPTYLKIDTFYLSKGSELYLYSSQGNFDYKNSFIQRDIPGSEEIKVIYKSKSASTIPTAEKVTEFKNKYYSVFSGLLKDYSNSIKYVSYKYTTYDKNATYPKPDSFEHNTFTYLYSSPEIESLTKSITKDKKTTYDKAAAIRDYLIENYEYSFNPDTPDRKTAVEDFLFKTKKGYCTHFAAAMSLMLASIGIDSRMVGGFYSDTYNKNLDAYVMFSNDLHVWNEVYIDGYGWVTFDPTTYKLADDMDPKGLTGAGRRLGGYENDPLNDEFEDIDPKISFDNLFNSKNLSGIGFNGNGYDFGDTAKDWNQRKIELEELRLKEEERKREEFKRQEEERKKAFEETFKWIGISFLGIILLAIMFYVAYIIHKRIKYQDMYKRLKDIKDAKNADMEIRRYFIKEKTLPEQTLNLSPKEFKIVLNQNSLLTNEVVVIYSLIDKVLYSQSYKQRDIDRMKDLVESITLVNH